MKTKKEFLMECFANIVEETDDDDEGAYLNKIRVFLEYTDGTGELFTLIIKSGEIH